MAHHFHVSLPWTGRVRPRGNSTCATAFEIFVFRIYPTGSERHDRNPHPRRVARPDDVAAGPRFAAN
jgi:hypothetical protein